MIRRVLAAAVLVALAAVLLVAVWPQLFGLERTLGVAHVVSLRAVAIAGAGVGVVAMLLLAVLAPFARRLAASVGALLLAFCAVSGVVLADRGFGQPAFETRAERDITVLSWNTLGNAPGAQRVADLALANAADVVAMPETTGDFGAQVAAILAAAGSPMTVLPVAFDEISPARSTTLLVSERLGAYVLDEQAGSTGQLPSVVAVPASGEGPTIVAAHPVAPISRELATWSNDLDWLGELCEREDIIVAGDLNSTVDHWGDGLGGCRDAASESGNAAVGTWPTALPPLLGTPIDHVLHSDSWRVVGMRVIESEDDSGSDHRPVVAQLRPAG
jgi:endonuclease/exonuclease/phosphatase (EEP) superfamily protein YafD